MLTSPRYFEEFCEFFSSPDNKDIINQYASVVNVLDEVKLFTIQKSFSHIRDSGDLMSNENYESLLNLEMIMKIRLHNEQLKFTEVLDEYVSLVNSSIDNRLVEPIQLEMRITGKSKATLPYILIAFVIVDKIKYKRKIPT